jgi:hypothetical protein
MGPRLVGLHALATWGIQVGDLRASLVLEAPGAWCLAMRPIVSPAYDNNVRWSTAVGI